MNMKYMRAGWVNNMDAKATYRWICHLVRLYKRAWASYPDNVGLASAPLSYSYSADARNTYTRMLISWLINDPAITIAALAAGNGE